MMGIPMPAYPVGTRIYAKNGTARDYTIVEISRGTRAPWSYTYKIRASAPPSVTEFWMTETEIQKAFALEALDAHLRRWADQHGFAYKDRLE